MHNVNEVLLTVMKDNKFTKSDMARLFGVTPQAIGNKFAKNKWSMDEVLKVLDHLGCKLIIESGEIRSYRF